MKDSPSLPPAPDYTGAAKAQGEANIESARQTARLNNPNIYSPYGSQTVTWGQQPNQNLAGNWGASSNYQPWDEAQQYGPQQLDPGSGGGDDVVNALVKAGFGKNSNNGSWSKPEPTYSYSDDGGQIQTGWTEPVFTPTSDGDASDKYAKDQPTITQRLSPQSQQIFDQQQAVKLGLAGLGQQGLKTAQSVLSTPMNYSGNIRTELPSVGRPLSAPDLFGYGSATGLTGSYGAPKTSFDLSNVAKMPINAGTTGYQAIMSRLDPQLTQQRNMTETALRNQGLVAGGEAYDAAERNLNQSQNDARLQAAAQAIGLDLTANQQGFNQAAAQGQFANAGQQQGFAQGVTGTQMGNQAVAQNQAAALQQQQAQNAAQQQEFQQALAGGQFGNTAQQQAYQQAVAQRVQPLNEITALMSGSQVSNPQFQGYTGSAVAPAPIANATQLAGQYGQGLYNAQVGQQNAATGGLYGLGAAGLNAYGTYKGLEALAMLL